MAVIITPGKRSYNLVWKIGEIKPSVSNPFSLEDSKWCFVLEQEINHHHNEEDWKMHLRKIHPREGNHIFLITIYLQDKNNKLECLNFTRLIVTKPGTDQIMWRRKSNVLDKYPDLVVDGDVSFVITFLSDHRYMTDIENYTENKRIQTPAFMEAHPSLQTLAMDFRKLADSGSETDVELRCGDRTLQAHKAVLIARSKVFAAMLQSNMVEKSEGFVEITDVEFSILEYFLRYLYAGTLPEMDIHTAAGLYEAADKYAVDSLKSRCAFFLTEHLTVDNACDLLVLADSHCDKSLKESVISYIIHKDILMYMEEGSAFCALHPKLAVDVLYRAYKIMKLSSKPSK